MYRTIKRVVKSIVHKLYFQTLQNHHTVYAKVCSLGILAHLHTMYGMLKDEDIQAIYVALNTPIKGETHFKHFMAQIKDNQEAVASQNPYKTR